MVFVALLPLTWSLRAPNGLSPNPALVLRESSIPRKGFGAQRK